MAVLKHLPSGVEYPLAARHVVGRSPPSQLLLDRPQVSGLHAELLWDGSRWVIQDLGSRNGTFVDGRRLEASERASLTVGSELTFGTQDERFAVTDTSAPRLMARAPDGRIVLAEQDMLCLPSDDDPQVTILSDALGNWTLEAADDNRTIVNQDTVTAGGVSWTVHIPDVVTSTRDLEDIPLRLGEATLELFVSRDEEHVGCRVLHGETRHELEPRAHTSLLLTLARARTADLEQAALPASEHGWVHREDLVDMLKIDAQLLNLWVHRARQQLRRAGVADAARAIERRSGTRQLRLGTDRFVIVPA